MGNRKGSKHTTFGKIRVELLVRYKPEVPDPAKADVAARLAEFGSGQITGVALAKFFQMKFSNTTLRRARADATSAAKKLLANPVTEMFEILTVVNGE